MNAASVYASGPLLVIEAVAEGCGLVSTLDEVLAWHSTQCVLSPGQRHLPLIMNFLTEGVALYRLPEFFENTDTENLFGDGITNEQLNHDACGRTLDRLADADSRTVLGTVLVEAATSEGVTTDVVHTDTTSVSVQGLYEADTGDDDLAITYGHSKDHRPDLKQYKLGVSVNRAGVPVSATCSTGTPRTRPGTQG